MSEAISNCPTCAGNIFETPWGGVNKLFSKQQVALINEYHPEKAAEYRCNKCGYELFAASQIKLAEEGHALSKKIEKLLSAMPIVSLQSPHDWEYSICSLVTAQTTTGTGFLSELTSSFADIFGAQSEAYNLKLKTGENLCKNMLRMEAMKLGANAIIAVDIDYAEVGGGKGMLMVCMSGTAILLKNTAILGAEYTESMDEVMVLLARSRHLSLYKNMP